MLDQSGDNGLGEPSALMCGLDRDFDHLEEEAAITDDPPHPDSLAIASDNHGVDGVRQPRRRALGRLR